MWRTRRWWVRLAPAVALSCVTTVVFLAAPPAHAATATIASRGPAAVQRWASESTTSLRLTPPVGVQAGDVLVASLGFGRTGAASQPVLTPPADWTLVRRTNSGNAGSLATYTHTFVAGESAYTFTTSVAVGGVAFVSAFGGVDRSRPVDVSSGQVAPTGTDVTAPSVTTSAGGEMLVASYFGYRGGGTSATSWTPPAGLGELGDAVNQSASRSATVAAGLQAIGGASGAKTARANVRMDYGVGVLVALRPGTTDVPPPPPPPPPSTGATPLIIDTDLFSDADDAGALAVGFGAQLRGEADVIGIALNTRTNRPAVATNTWRCAAAIAQFYGDPNVPIGSYLPDNGTAVNTIDFIKPCAQQASPSTPTPGSAVSMYRKALAAQPDGSVVIASAGYLGNLRDLLDSGPDSFSSLSGRDLVAAKVRSLVVMGGGYPSRSSENNLAGDPAAAQRVASGWPTRIVWSGYEVGDNVHTGDTISSVHPANSPIRIAYEAFVGPRKWIYSYDLTAVYEAIRPNDSVFGLVGPGTNTVTSTGGNSFSLGSGNQYYLTLPSATAANSAIEALLDVLPGSTPPPPPPSGTLPADTFSTGTIDTSRWVVGGTGSSVTSSNAELEIAHPGGSWTTGSLTSAGTYDQTGRSVQLRLRRPANGGGSTSSGYGETSVRVMVDSTHYAELYVASGSLTAWYNAGAGQVNLTPSWPAYSATTMQWVRFREAGGQLFYEYASGTTAPGTWQTLASTPDPFAMTAVRLTIIAGCNTSTTDVAQFDDIATS